MTAVDDLESAVAAAAASAEERARHRRTLLALAALTATIVLALVADRMACRCGASSLAAQWLGSRRPRACQGGAPNFILFSLDGGTTAWPWEVAYRRTIVHSGARNPNGCRMPMTWFSSCCHGNKSTGECDIARQAYEAGHELASHTMTHPDKRWMQLGYDELAREIGGQRSWLVDNCSIPFESVVGFRAPGFRTNELIGHVLADLGFKYDSSHPETWYRQRAGAMDSGFRLAFAPEDQRHNWTDLPLWEIPAMRLPGGTKRMDPMPVPGMTIRQRLKADFERKRGCGVPVPILAHIGWIKHDGHRGDVVEFLRWAMRQRDTWFLTYSQYMAWAAHGPGANMTEILAAYPCERV